MDKHHLNSTGAQICTIISYYILLYYMMVIMQKSRAEILYMHVYGRVEKETFIERNKKFQAYKNENYMGIL